MPPVIAVVGAIAATLGVSATSLVIGLLATAAKFGLAYYQAQKNKQSSSTVAQDIQQNIRQNVVPRYVVLGKARVGGVTAFFEAVDEFLYMATILSDDIIDGIDTFWVRDIECLVDANLRVTTPPFNTTEKKLVKFELHHGYTDQPASTMLVGAFPSVVTAGHTGAGVAYLVTELQQPEQDDFQSVYNSSVPSIACLVRGVLAYDPREPSHKPAKSDTWDTTTNPALLLLYYFTANNGFGLPRSLFDGNSFIAVADFCDELVETKDAGNRKRYEMGGVYSYDTEPADIVEEILKTFGGQIFVTSDGLFGLTCDDFDVAEILITQDMIVEIEARRNTGALYEYSTVKTRYTSEHHGWVTANEEADPWIDDDVVARIGRQIPFQFDLPFVFRHDQARRLMKRQFLKLTPEWSLDLVIDFNGLELFGERVCRIVYPPLDIDQTFRLESVAPDGGLGFARIQVKASSIPVGYSIWRPLQNEGTAPAIPPSTSESDAPQTPTGVSALVGNDAGNIRALITWTAKTGGGKNQDAQWKLSSDSAWTSLTAGRDDRSATIDALTNGLNYNFRVRVTSRLYGVSSWATLSFVATAVAGSTGSLQSLTASDGVLSSLVTVQQASTATAAYVQIKAMPDGDAVTWGGSTKIAARSGDTVSTKLTLEPGDWDVYARSEGINGDFGAVEGPDNATVADEIDTGGSGGAGGGAGGAGDNDGGSPIGGSGGDSEAPSQQGGIY